VASAVVGRRLLAVCRDERWCARFTRHHGRAVGSPVLTCLAKLPSRCVVDSYAFPNELLFAGQMASFIQVTAGQPALPLAGWQSFVCGSRQRRGGLREWFAMVVTLLLTRSEC